MTDPRLALAWFTVGAAATLAVVWPRTGLAARLRRRLRLSERARTEDTLKYLVHRSSDERPVHLDAVAGALAIPRPFAHRLLERLVTAGLAHPSDHGYRLTDDGRAAALQLVRSHRLLERFLADRTGLAPDEWHEVAEEEEHRLSSAEIDALAARLGQPRFDPHGEPIPTAQGELPVPLDALPEPVSLSLPASRAASATAIAPARTLADLPVGATGRVTHLTPECRGPQRRRLLDLGVVPGTPISAEMRSASGDPIAYRIRGALVALRRQQARWIAIDPATEPAIETR
ncbi:MAG: Iron-dependent repressor IdeR [Gemmatimonadota bacterium]|jgi:DtxR family Mn-dependent transcriptional regulator